MEVRTQGSQVTEVAGEVNGERARAQACRLCQLRMQFCAMANHRGWLLGGFMEEGTWSLLGGRTYLAA